MSDLKTSLPKPTMEITTGALAKNKRKVATSNISICDELSYSRLYDRLCKEEECMMCPNGNDGVCRSSGTLCKISRVICGDDRRN
ncbi:hypothetical protein KIN20_000686 [Parelaphostrongylus tenuis]|uniref:Uncharacterized protein n=1 Tax=Parelaphostrongylus tenuis TaxID=148309 RepID=A0AAD5LSX2_PARTN|nr:hypothetical protein KIN20_000686 [Parelaphostrongylus tenuis]